MKRPPSGCWSVPTARRCRLPLAGISGVVLVRRSAGPAAYRQMLARALAACGSVPVAELSAAFEALTCAAAAEGVQRGGGRSLPAGRALSACRRAYRQLRRALDSDWERYYAAAKQMTAEGKTLDVPRSYSFGGVAVGRWLENQRLVRAGKKRDASPPRRLPGWTKSA